MPADLPTGTPAFNVRKYDEVGDDRLTGEVVIELVRT